MKKRFFLILVLVMVSSCAALVPVRSPDVRQYALSLEASSALSRPLPQGLESRDLTLVVRQANAPSYINSRNIVFSRSPETRGTYQLSTWIESPPESFTRILSRRLEDSGLFRQVAKSPTTASADLFLATEFAHFYHDVASAPGEVVVEIRAELTRVHRRQILNSRNFSRRLQGDTFDAHGAVVAFNAAIGEIVDEIILWVHEVSDEK